ncbi:HD domain-containing protein [Enterobacter hormaechei]|uniref:HD domain-containing protein n=1 Tax=Enterobacter hormaechei TaxID=158836 RepID=UPI0006651674|nr:ATP-binding protein [Enterobacter hormaechei]
MINSFEKSNLWQLTLGLADNEDIERLRNSYFDFRRKIEPLVKNIEFEIPGLTIHDISHIDSLWEVADQIIGENYYLNPIEAYVLGGSFLLHDAAHVSAAYNGGFTALKERDEWKDLISLKYNNIEPEKNSELEKRALFEIVRQLHAKQARNLIQQSWKSETNQNYYFLIADEEIRDYYSEIIGEIAESHHWSAKKVNDSFSNRVINPPAFFKSTNWEVDPLKIAFILRTTDASHIDSRRAPTYAFNILTPQGLSKDHWHFQNKLGRAKLVDGENLRVSSGSSFNENERNAWWLAFDTARMINRELKDANSFLIESGRPPLAAKSVLGAESPKSFSKYVLANNWEPEDISVHVSNLPRLISTLGGKALYGENKYVALRELIQNGFDAIIAARNLGYLESFEGHITIQLNKIDNESWMLNISDNGLGMSRYVLSDVLLDFGKSLWNHDTVRYEHPKLAQTGFSSIGQFGIGFYSAFMISNHVKIITHRYKLKSDESNSHWKLTFPNGLEERPFISKPNEQEELKKHGTTISLRIENETLNDLLIPEEEEEEKEIISEEKMQGKLKKIIKLIFPACEIDIYLITKEKTEKIISANDWLEISDIDLLRRIHNKSKEKKLYPLKVNGRTVGRLRITSHYYFLINEYPPLIVSYKGARAGQIYGLDGLCLSFENNEKAERNDALPNYPLESWIDWAREIVSSESMLSIDLLLKLHILLPNDDLNVWFISNKRCSLSDIKNLLISSDEILFHIGDLEYDDDDSVRKTDFERDLMLENNVIVSHSNSVYHFHEAFTFDKVIEKYNLPRVSYAEKLEDLIKEIWGDFEEKEEYEVIGLVNNTEIMRRVTKYSKVTFK